MAAAGFTVLFRAHPRDAGWVLAGGTVAYAGSRLGGRCEPCRASP
jgi:uncharacterized membrane protein YjjB (DUF3815 family)